MIVVLDTNILVSALMSQDNACRQVIRLAFEGGIQPIVGDALYYEYEFVLLREELFRRGPFDAKKRLMLLEDFSSVCRWVEIHFLWRPNLRDKGDNHIVELAFAGGAQRIVTRNIRDFEQTQLALPQIAIVDPVEFLNERRNRQWRH